MVRLAGRRGFRAAHAAGCGLALACAFALAGMVAPSAHAQTSLGGQRVGTSSGDFLKIGAGAKAVSMGEAFIAIADDPSALYWNPAGIASADSRAILFSHTSWLTDVSIEYLAAIAPVPRLAGGVAGVQVAGLSTELDETSELQPDGTGRSFSYSDLLIGAGYARYFTDKFAIGFNVKYLREDLGSEVGGGVVNTWLADLGTMYHIGFHDMNFAVAITNFGPEITPNEGYVRVNQSGGFTLTQDADFIGFAPPTTFKIGLSSTIFDSDDFHGVGSLEMNRPGDNAETIKLGGEVLFRERIALRAGYDANADELKFSGGAGFQMTHNARSAAVDYAFTNSESFGRIDRIALVVEF
ncbi:MAG: PorV/PorQ family protein [bacterium]